MDDTPRRSSDFIKKMKLTRSPPLLASKIMGLVVTSKISLTMFSLDEISFNPKFGFPLLRELVSLLENKHQILL